MAFYEHHSRSLAKTVTYRALIVISNSVIIYAITRQYATTAVVVIVSNFASTILYFFHERVWNHVHWGKVHRNQK